MLSSNLQYLLLKTGKSIEIGTWPRNRPGPKPDSSQSFSICHWNLNSMLAHNYSKISLLTTYISIHNFDIICLSQTCLTSTTDINDENLKIPGYIIYRVDHPFDIK